MVLVERRLRPSEYARKRGLLRLRVQQGERLWMAPVDRNYTPRIKELGGHWENGDRGVDRGWVFETEQQRAACEAEVQRQLPLPLPRLSPAAEAVRALRAHEATVRASPRLEDWLATDPVGQALGRVLATRGAEAAGAA